MQSVFPDSRPLSVGSVTQPEWPNTCVDPWQLAISATR